MAETLANYALTTLERVKGRAGITDTTNDADLRDRINELSFYIHGDGETNRGILNRHLSVKAYSNELYKAPKGQELRLNNYPINSVSSLGIGYISPDSTFVTTYDVTRYVIHRNKWSLIYNGGWYSGPNYDSYYSDSSGYGGGYGGLLSRQEYDNYNIQVSYNAGYTTIPEDIQGAVANIISNQVKRDRTGGQGLKRYSIDDITIEWMDYIVSKHDYKTIMKYKRVLVGAC